MRVPSSAQSKDSRLTQTHTGTMLDRPEKGPHGRPAGRYFRSVLTQAGASCDVGGSAQRLSRGLPTFCGAVFLVFDGSVESRRQMVTCGQKPLVCFSSVYPDVVKLRTDRSATTSGSRAWCACSRCAFGRQDLSHIVRHCLTKTQNIPQFDFLSSHACM